MTRFLNALALSLLGWPAVAMAATPETAPVRYPADRVQSPITHSVVSSMRAILARGAGQDPHVFIKVGDSITDAAEYLFCYTEKDLPWGVTEKQYRNYDGRGFEVDAAYFSTVLVSTSHGATTLRPPFERTSSAARVGESSEWLPQNPQPLDEEIADLHPAFALIMFGSNDLGFGGGPSPETDIYKFAPYAQAMADLVDMLMARGVIPVLSTIPPRTDSARYNLLVPSFNAVVRGLAEARQTPLIDYHRDMAAIPASMNFGLGSDGLHPSVYPGGWPALACNLTAPALQYGYNARNLSAMGTLDRLRQVFAGNLDALDAAAPERPLAPAGAGTGAAPFVVDALPFTDVRDIRGSTHKEVSSYSACPGFSRGWPTAFAGPEYVYKLALPAARRLRVFATERTGSPVDLILAVSADALPAGSCRKSAHDYLLISGAFQPGVYYFTLDAQTLPATGNGEYFFAIVPCEDGDTACDTVIAGGPPQATPSPQPAGLRIQLE